ncbi:biotin--[acetyl-CoA-carboxylase] ligase [Curvibacter sp. HBC61]|uniref:biotin--[biotin carboxyl-carrier protein] ligase n=1 Tax=Curvibacter cyanobacteriorum TaxID=3026422 RepID=A0ABT5N010_9BURK|nr:biotin--[acetyl-CoA-carboxylase] ligase [Curvibacter sp. HBC61]MDD0839432.1 biotin--[acetyl-CoA-carboxylase] ligase [Curvibacter sp. HBC61]
MSPLPSVVRWPAEAVWQAVQPLWPSFSVEVLPEIDSTNTELMRRARAGRDECVLLVAQRQTAGRGRMGRVWQSGAEGSLGDAADGPPSLMMSLGLPLAPRDWSGLSLAVGLSLAESLDPGGTAGLGLKWPNDLWLQDRKVGGILIETAGTGAVAAGQPVPPRYVVIGIGLNVLPRQAEGLSTPPACLRDFWPEATAPHALERVVPALARTVHDFAEQGFAPLQTRFATRDVLRGRGVRASDGLEGTSLGVGADGALLVHTLQGTQAIHSAEVSVRPVAAPD